MAEPQHYEDGKYVKDTPIGLIVMSGKRQPPHPAMTRYLVAHEYGHNVEWMLERVRDSKTLHSGEVVAEYAKLRGLPDDALHHGSGGRWHDSATEIFACDFRILVGQTETEHWPHPGIPHPVDVDADLAAWWAQSLDEMSKYAPPTKPESE